MTLIIHTEEDEQRQLKVTVEVPEERVQKQMKHKARHLARTLNIPGFRRGKAPYQVILRRFGPEAVRADTVEDMLDELLTEALEEVEVDAYRQPSFEDMELKPLVLKITIPLEPVVTVGDYRAFRKEVEPVVVTDEALEEALEHVRSHHQVLEEVDRPVEEGDMVTLSGTAWVPREEEEDDEEEEAVDDDEAAVEAAEETTNESDLETDDDQTVTDVEDVIEQEDEEGEIIWQQTSVDLVMDPEQVFSSIPFVDNIIGSQIGDELTFTATFPTQEEDEDIDESIAGKEATFEVTILNVQSRYLPELDDELAQQEGDFESLAELRDALEEELYEQAENEAREVLIDDLLEALTEDAELAYPPVLVESEINDAVESLKQQVGQAGLEWEEFVTFRGGSEEEVREQYRESATERVERGLLLREFVRLEYIQVEDEDIDRLLDKRLARFPDEALREQLRDIYKQGDALEEMINEAIMDKVHERAKAIAAGEAPDLEELAAAAAAKEEESDATDEEE